MFRFYLRSFFTTCTLDLAVGLTQILSDGTAQYL
jgi:hypothetical protein